MNGKEVALPDSFKTNEYQEELLKVGMGGKGGNTSFYKDRSVGRFAVILGLSAVASAGVIGAPVAAIAAPIAVDSWAVPSYSFNYGVSDAVTGDNHGRWESRDGDVTKGGYQLVEPDGTIRLVEYTSDPINGFNAIVRKGPGASVHSAVPAVAALGAVASPLAAVSRTYAAAAAPVAPVGAIAAAPIGGIAAAAPLSGGWGLGGWGREYYG